MTKHVPVTEGARTSRRLCLATLELREQALRSNLPIRLDHELSDLLPVNGQVEVHAKPAVMAHVGRHEEALGIGGDECLLRLARRCTPECQPVVMMMIGIHHEGLPVLHEPGGLAVAQAFGQLGEGEAEATSRARY